MHIKRQQLLLFASLLVISIIIFRVSNYNATSNIVYTYATHDYTGDDYSYNSFVNNYSHINYIITFSYGIDRNGNLTGKPDERIIDFAIKNDVIPLLLVHNMRNESFDASLLNTILNNSYAKQNLINNIIKAIKVGNFKGVNIDFENISYKNRSSYLQFLRDLNAKLKQNNFLLTVAIPALVEDSPSSAWAGGIDYKEISKIVDKAIIMGYDEHWIGGESGPVSSYNWIVSVTKYALMTIDKDKIVMGLPAYGYDWSSKGNTVVTEETVKDLVNKYGGNIKWDDNYKEPYYIYYKDGVKHAVWFENSKSFKLKIDYLNSVGINNISFWRLGYETKGFWEAIGGNKADYFNDISSSWARDDINYMASKGYISGYEDGSFRPNNLITKAEFVSMVLRVKGIKEEPGDGFIDTKFTFAKNSIATAKKYGIVNGYPDGTFRPNKHITREEIAAIVASTFGIKPYNETKFTDISGSYAKDEIAALENLNIISGYGNMFKPLKNSTRAEAIAILHRMIEHQK